MNRFFNAAMAATMALALAPAAAQTYRDSGGTIVSPVAPLVGCSAGGNCAGPVSSTNPLPVSGVFSATLSGFQPTPAYSQLTVSAASSRVALPSGATVVVYNTGANAAYLTLGNASVTATTANDLIQPNSWMAFTVGTNTYIAAIETAGATALNISGGSGLPAGAGGGAGGGSNASVGSTGSAVPGSGAYAAMNVGGNLTGLTGTAYGLKVDPSAVTSPVSLASLPALATGANTIGAVTQSGTWTMQPGNTANTTAWLVTGTGGTFPASESGAWNITNISGTVSLPTGAATSANQPSAISAAGAMTAGETGNLAFGAVTTSAPSYTTAQTDPLSLTNAGELRVDCTTGCAGGTFNNNADGLATSTTNGQAAAWEYVFNGSTWDRLRGDTTNGVWVNVKNANANGQQAMAASSPVVIASNQSAVPASQSGAWTDRITGNAGATLDATLAAGAAPTNGVAVIGQYNSAAPAPSNGQTVALQMDSSGNAKVVGVGLTQGSTTSGQTGSLIMGEVTTAAPAYTTAQTQGVSLTTHGLLRTAPVSDSGNVLGSYCMSAASGTMAAGLSSGSPIFSFRYGGANLAIVRKVTISAGDTSTAFTAGVATFNLFAARSFSASDTGGNAATLTGNNGKLRTSFATTGLSDFRTSATATLTAGTRTLDAAALASYSTGLSATAGINIVPIGTTLIGQESPSEQPLQLAQNEGFVLQATVPATGTWTFSAQACWDEVSAY